jgi:hypothetical protein
MLGGGVLERHGPRTKSFDGDAKGRRIGFAVGAEDLCSEWVDINASYGLLHVWQVVLVSMDNRDNLVPRHIETTYLTGVLAQPVYNDRVWSIDRDLWMITADNNCDVHTDTPLLTIRRTKSVS